MTRIVYKKMLGRYLIDSVIESGGDGGVTIELSEPIDARLVIHEEVHPLKHGICHIKNGVLKNGEIFPKCCTGAGVYELEGFYYKDGAVIRTVVRDSLVYDTAKCANALMARIESAEERLLLLEEQIARKINLL